MKQINILLLLVSLTLLVNFNNYIDKDETKDIRKIKAITKRIASEKRILKEKKNFIEAKKNLSIFFSSKIDNNLALGEFQKDIKKMAKKAEFKISNISWGEPTVDKKLNLVQLPLKIVANSTPHAFSIFTKQILEYKKMIKIDMVSLRKNRKNLAYSLYLFTYKKLEKKIIDEK